MLLCSGSKLCDGKLTAITFKSAARYSKYFSGDVKSRECLSSELINKELKNSNLPEEIRIGAVLRNKKVIIPKSDFIFLKDDQIVLIVKKDTVGVVENLFRLSSV